MAGCESFKGRGLRQRSGLTPRFSRPCSRSPVRLLRIDRLFRCLSSCRIARGDPQPRSAQLCQPRSESRPRSPASERTTSRRGPVQKPCCLPTSPCNPSSRQAHRRDISFHCTGVETHCSRCCKDRAGREAEAAFRGGVGTGGEGFRKFPTGGRDFSKWVRTMPGVAGPSGSVGNRIDTSPRGVGTVEGWCGSRCIVWSKRETAMSHRRGAKGCPSHANFGSRVEHVVGGTPSDLCDALLQGESNRALELTAKLSDGVEQMVEMTNGMRP